MTVEQLVKICLTLKLNPTQVVSLYYTEQNQKCPLHMTNDEYKDLYDKGYMIQSKPTTKYIKLLDKLLEDLGKPRTAIKPVVCPSLNKLIPELQKLLLQVAPTEDEEERVKAFFKDETLTALYFTWMYLFPTVSTDNANRNSSWEQLFGVKYKGNRLRQINEAGLNNFASIARKLDIGIYIFGTFLFIKDGIRENGDTYISKQANFFKVHDDWYCEAKRIVDETSDINQLFAYFQYKQTKSTLQGSTMI